MDMGDKEIQASMSYLVNERRTVGANIRRQLSLHSGPSKRAVQRLLRIVKRLLVKGRCTAIS
jgi:hypothetical protein